MTSIPGDWTALGNEPPEIKEGRDLDIYIEQCITGQNWDECRIDPTGHGRNGEPQFHYEYPIGHDFAPAYSTDDSVAWSIIRRFSETGMTIAVFTHDGKYTVENYPSEKPFKAVGSIKRETLALAVCDVLVQFGIRLKEILNVNGNLNSETSVNKSSNDD